MQQKHLDKIFDYLKVVQRVYNVPGWDGGSECAISQDVVNNTRVFLETLQKNIPLNEIPITSNVFPDERGFLGIEWAKINKSPYYMDLFYVFIKPSPEVEFESDLESLGTQFNKAIDITEELDEQLLIHIRHFS